MNEVYLNFLRTMSVFSVLSDIPETKRTEEQRQEMFEAVSDLTKNFKAYFDFLSEKFYTYVKNYEFPQDAIDELLRNDITQPPVLEADTSLQILVDKMNKAHVAYNTITGMLEIYEPVYDRFIDEEKRLQRLVRGMTLSDKEWKASGIYEVLHNQVVHNTIKTMGTSISMLKWRKTRIEYAYTVISRMLSANLGDKTGEVSVIDTENKPRFMRQQS